MKLVLENKNQCTGCNFCAEICPKNAIEMKEDVRGYKYPYINEEKCINCGICKKQCPNVQVREKNTYELSSYAIKNKSDEERLTSSSGAFFIELARYFIDRGGVVFGAAYDDKLEVIHKLVNKKEELEDFKGSKYVQSNNTNIYSKVKECLIENKLVLFSGTPCQISGLYAFLNQKYDNLVTCDVICHGVPSPKIFSEYKSFLVRKYKSKIENISFRNKTIHSQHNLHIQFEDGKVIKKLSYEDIYYKLFADDLNIRESCLNCIYANTNRVSDITMGDFWNGENVLPNFKDYKGASIILVNTDKGKSIFENIKNKYYYENIDLNKCLQWNLQKPTKKSDNYERFWNDYEKDGFGYVTKKYGRTKLKRKIKLKLKQLLRKIKNE